MFSQVTCLHQELTFPGNGLAMGIGELIPWFALLVDVAIAFPVKVSLSQ